MSYLLDTNVISEWVEPRPHPHVVRWLAAVDEGQTYLSVVSFAEIRQGVEEMSPGSRRDAIASWLERDLLLRFERRIVALDVAIAHHCGALLARSNKLELNLHVMDAWYAATGAALGFTLVTRNSRQFRSLNPPPLNPWLNE
ncbi:MAG: type II toxin-antitoxin system VapC family toxin [Candidatus Acidiferrales bacterium]